YWPDRALLSLFPSCRVAGAVMIPRHGLPKPITLKAEQVDTHVPTCLGYLSHSKGFSAMVSAGG
ncbi:MAG: hypothetical protein K2G64_04965, partial [Muribaculaceae bacterium]|nr:hypothetical protein [Muribaculaceae bacterium]